MVTIQPYVVTTYVCLLSIDKIHTRAAVSNLDQSKHERERESVHAMTPPYKLKIFTK